MSRNTTFRVVSLTQSSGVELNAYLVGDSKPTRQEQKLKTLSEYVQQYPSGWKKRLELANRMTTKIEDAENINEKAIDYAKVDEQMKAHREVAKEYLRKNLEE